MDLHGLLLELDALRRALEAKQVGRHVEAQRVLHTPRSPFSQTCGRARSLACQCVYSVAAVLPSHGMEVEGSQTKGLPDKPVTVHAA